ncbi:MAG: RNA polymerase factor sigma-54, partial [Waddliaceae bacterium]
KKRPLSDEALSRLMRKKGIMCARRTVAKYRAAMNLGSSKQRRRY